jgi:hypothetical protein
MRIESRPLSLVGLVLLLSIPGPAADKQVALVSADARSVTLEVTLPPYQIQNVPCGGIICQEINVPGWPFVEEAGQPKLPKFGTLVEIPAVGGCRITILEDEHDSQFGYEIPPVPKTEWDGGRAVHLAETPQGVAYGQNSLFPGRLATVSGRIQFRHVPVARLIVFPFQWNPVTKELQVHKRIRVRVDFDGTLTPASGAGAASDEEFETISQALIINHVPRERPRLLGRERSMSLSALPSEAVRIEVETSGLYRLGYQELADLEPSTAFLNPATLSLTHRGREVAFSVYAGPDNRWGPGDSIEFYAGETDSDYSRIDVYWLTWDSGNGKRLRQRSVPYSGSGEAVRTFRDDLLLEENNNIWYQTPSAPESDYWFWKRLIAPGSFAVSFGLPDDFAGEAGPAEIQVGFQGQSITAPHPNHHTALILNGVALGDETWDADVRHVQTVACSQSQLQKGPNTLEIVLPGDTGATDAVYLDWVKVRYWRELDAGSGEMTFGLEGDGGKSIEVKGFRSGSLQAFDISDPEDPVELRDFSVVRQQDSYTLRFDDQVAGSCRYHVATSDMARAVHKLELWRPAGLSDSGHRADLVIIAPREFRKAMESLIRRRQSNGIRAFFTAVEDIYNEFNNGLPDPSAIKRFLACAYENWARPAPAYVLLVGDANIDYKQYLANDKPMKVPVHLSLTADLGLTPDDNWYACVDGDDDLPDMFIGRIPGSSAAAVSKTVAKLIGQEDSHPTPLPRMLLVADDDDPQFEEISDSIVPFAPGSYSVDKVYLAGFSAVSQATQAIISAVNAGVSLVSYVGHGSVTAWTGAPLFDNATVSLLQNPAQLALFCMFTCLNGFFAAPTDYCLAEALVAADNRGAFACFAPSGWGYPWEHAILASELMAGLFRGRAETMGLITTRAKIAAFSRGASVDLLKTFTLFGDPSLKLWNRVLQRNDGKRILRKKQ